MNLSKAIEILELRVASPFVRANQDTKDAINLGIEALKRIQDLRSHHIIGPIFSLPGETPDGNPLPRLANAIEIQNKKRGTT